MKTKAEALAPKKVGDRVGDILGYEGTITRKLSKEETIKVCPTHCYQEGDTWWEVQIQDEFENLGRKAFWPDNESFLI